MSLATKVVIGASVVGLAVGGMELAAPKTPQEVKHYQQQQEIEQYGTNQEHLNEQNAAQANETSDAVHEDRLRPAEIRPEGDLPDLHLHLPLP